MLCLKNIVKVYGNTQDNMVAALKGVSVNFRRNEFVSILGQSGCGKTTLLNIIGGLDRYTKGDLIISGKSTKDFTDRDWDAYRNNSIGFVFQTYNLIPHQTVLGNVELALTLSGVSKAERRERALEVLEKVGLKDKVNARPNQLSGGQMQRVALARALVNNPEVILADEPTGALDSETSIQVMDLLKEIAKDRLVIMVTHNPELAEKYSTRIIKLLDGELVGDSMPFSDEEAEAAQKEFDAKLLAEKAEEERIAKGIEEKGVEVTKADDTAKPKKAKKKKTAMSFFTALNLSFKNLLTKKGRTIITSFAGSIGIIGVCLVLAISNGFSAYINNLQSGTLGGYPVQITQYAADLEALNDLGNEEEKLPEYPEGDDNLHVYDPTESIQGIAHLNVIDKDYFEYVDKFYKEDKEKSNNDRLTSAVQYGYSAVKHVVSNYDDAVYGAIKDDSAATDTISIMSIFMGSSSSVFQEGLDNDEFVNSQYDLIYGTEAKEDNELMLVVDSRNRLSISTLDALGIQARDGMEIIDSISFEDIVNKAHFRLVYNDAYYTKVTEGGIEYYKPISAEVSPDWEDFYNNLAADDYVDLKITGVYRINEDSPLAIYNTGIVYRKGLTDLFLSNCKDSEIVAVQKQEFESVDDINSAFLYGDYKALINTFEATFSELGGSHIRDMITMLGGNDYKVPVGVLRNIYAIIFDSVEEDTLNNFIKEFSFQNIGGSDLPSTISIYPKGFEEKKEILSYLDKWNEITEAKDHKILYTDAAAMLTNTLGQIVNIIKIVLIAFSAVSLVVSSIMIGIITYVSVIERTKEIGVLRSVGARKKDISRVFNAETLLIGFVAGLMGVLITYILCLILVNPIINVVAAGAVKNIALLNPLHALIMVGISMVLTLIGGTIPAHIASKKDPVEALRTE